MFLTDAASLIYDSLLSLFYPQFCVNCSELVSARRDGVACSECWAKISLFNATEALCWKCGAPLTSLGVNVRRESIRCGRCDEDSFTAARSCGVYEGALRASVLALKSQPYLCGRLQRVLLEIAAKSPLTSATLVVPVPLHPQREKKRGFNQASVIAAGLSSLADLPVCESNLVRTSHSERHRAGMDAKARRDSVANAFAVRHPSVFEGEHVLLVDDVFTSGATASACSTALLKAGATEVLVLTLARAGTLAT